jgi:hypothetical protein
MTDSRTGIGVILYTEFPEIIFRLGEEGMAAVDASSFLPAPVAVHADERDAVLRDAVFARDERLLRPDSN